jgi:hypothetical protein
MTDTLRDAARAVVDAYEDVLLPDKPLYDALYAALIDLRVALDATPARVMASTCPRCGDVALLVCAECGADAKAEAATPAPTLCDSGPHGLDCDGRGGDVEAQAMTTDDTRYPTAWAYEQVCAALHRLKARHAALVAAARVASLLAHPAILTGSVDHGQREFPCGCAAHEALRAALASEEAG